MIDVYYFLQALIVFISSLCQILLKKAALKTYSSKFKEYLNITVIGTYLLFLSLTLLSVICLRFILISHVMIIDSTGYIWVTLLSRFLLNEKISKKNIYGIIIIIIGILIIIL